MPSKSPDDFFKRLHRDAMRLVDACDESENNAKRDEADFLRANLKSCVALAERIRRRARKAKKTLARKKG